jgi:cytochrome c biogenesis protein CcdA
MSQLIAVVVLIAVGDSVNPSTIAPALYLAAGAAAFRSLLGFIAGVFVVNLVGGLLILLGPGQALLALIPRPGVELRHLLELCLGVGLLVLAAVLWLGRKRVAHHVSRNQGRIDRSSFLVGAGIMAVELPTAVPYLAAIAAIVGSGKNVSTQIGLLVVFNAVFIAPLAGDPRSPPPRRRARATMACGAAGLSRRAARAADPDSRPRRRGHASRSWNGRRDHGLSTVAAINGARPVFVSELDDLGGPTPALSVDEEACERAECAAGASRHVR